MNRSRRGKKCFFFFFFFCSFSNINRSTWNRYVTRRLDTRYKIRNVKIRLERVPESLQKMRRMLSDREHVQHDGFIFRRWRFFQDDKTFAVKRLLCRKGEGGSNELTHMTYITKIQLTITRSRRMGGGVIWYWIAGIVLASFYYFIFERSKFHIGRIRFYLRNSRDYSSRRCFSSDENVISFS